MKLLSSAAVRRAIIADVGHVIITADYDQIELRVAAALSRETALIEAAKRGESLHKIAAVKLFGIDFTPDQYRYTKNVNFGWLYGGGPFTLSQQAGIPFETAKEIIDQYRVEFPALTRYKRQQQDKLIRGALTPHELRLYYSLKSSLFAMRQDTASGRSGIAQIRRRINELLEWKVGYIETDYGRRLPVELNKAYRVVNYEVQSNARDIMGDGLIAVMADPELAPTVLLPIHDEILGQARRNKAEYTAQRYGEVMSTEFRGVPITASGKVYGKSWGHGYMEVK